MNWKRFLGVGLVACSFLAPKSNENLGLSFEVICFEDELGLLGDFTDGGLFAS